MVVYREKLGEVEGFAGDYSRWGRGCHPVAGRTKGAGGVWEGQDCKGGRDESSFKILSVTYIYGGGNIYPTHRCHVACLLTSHVHSFFSIIIYLDLDPNSHDEKMDIWMYAKEILSSCIGSDPKSYTHGIIRR